MTITQTTLVSSNNNVFSISVFDNKSAKTVSVYGYKIYLHQQFCLTITVSFEVPPFFLLSTFQSFKYILPTSAYIHPRTSIETTGCWGCSLCCIRFVAKAFGSANGTAAARGREKILDADAQGCRVESRKLDAVESRILHGYGGLSE